jgi:peroxidase
VPSAYGGDGLEDAAGSDRVSTRLISNVLFTQDKGTPTASIPSKQGLNDLHLHMGQFIAHDVSFVTPLADFYAAGNLAIPVPEGDTTFDPDYTGEAVIRFRRSGGKQGTGRKYGVPKEQVNKVTGWLDLSVVYGSAAERAVAIRTMNNGKIEMQMDGQNLAYNVKGIANLNLLGKKIERLVISGDNRVNVQPGLLTMHTLWAREHNRVVDTLIEKDPTVSDRDLFLRARRFTVSTYQSIVLYEWLPTVIGDEFMRKFKLHSYEAGGK